MIRHIGTDRLGPRLSELHLHSEALGRETRVRILAPADGPDGLPVLFLLHGGGSESDQTNWTDRGQAEEVTQGRPLLVVMPDGGKGGWYSDWLRPHNASEGSQRWEQYHLGELLPFIQDHFRTRTDRAGTAVAGLSMGGFGAIHYAARHPDRFGFAAAFSGAVDVRHPGIGRVVKVSPEIMGGRRGDIFGDHRADEMRWRAANPIDLASNLVSVEVQLRTGNGEKGGPLGDGPVGDTQEVGVSQATANLHRRLEELGIPHLYDDYGPGAHTWPYWTSALAASIDRIAAVAAERKPDPISVDHLAFETEFSVWGHTVEIERDHLEPVTFTVHPQGCALRGRSAVPARITTPSGNVIETMVVLSTGA